MKNFNDLKFKPHPSGLGGKQAVMFFSNNYGVSVITGAQWYSTGNDSYEVAILEGSKEDYSLCYSTDITDDVIGYQTHSEVTDIMKQVQEL